MAVSLFLYSCLVPSVLTLGFTLSVSEPLTLNATLTQVAHQKDINSICFSPNDKLLATGSQDKTAKVFHCFYSFLGFLHRTPLKVILIALNRSGVLMIYHWLVFCVATVEEFGVYVFPL